MMAFFSSAKARIVGGHWRANSSVGITVKLLGTYVAPVGFGSVIWNAIDLMRKLEEFKLYYNENRVCQSLSGSTPGERSGKPPPAHVALDHDAWRHHCRGLFQMPIAAKLRIRHGQENLNLMTKRELHVITRSIPGWRFDLADARLFGWKSNIILFGSPRVSVNIFVS